MNTEVIAGKYQVLEQLGRGGMGCVYKVRHLELDAIFALKILLDDFTEDQWVARFLNEARIMAKLKHPHIVQVFDVAREAERYYFVMEYVPGRTLAELIEDRGLLPLAEMLDISRQVCQALAYAHAQEPAVVHRDIKPTNILIEDNTGRVVVTDFGIAKLLTPERTQFTQRGFMVGTPSYAPPEQLRSDSTLDGRADIFSLGLVMYEMITGQKFFEGMSLEEIVGLKLYDPRELELHFTPDTPMGLRQLITRAVVKDRDKRYSSISELLRELDGIESSGETIAVKTTPPKSPTTLWPWVLALVLGGTGLAGWYFWPWSPKPIALEWIPKQATLALPEGQSQDFEVRPIEAGTEVLSYRWLLDDESIETIGPRWRYQPGYQDSGVHTVGVRVSTAEKLIDTHEWQVDVSDVNRPPHFSQVVPDQDSVMQPPPEENNPPLLIGWTPQATQIEIAQGQSQSFSVEVLDIDANPNLRYQWSLDSSVVATSLDWLYKPDKNAGSAHTVQVLITDSKGAMAQQSWQVNVLKPEPVSQPLMVKPAQQSITVQACQSQIFQIEGAGGERYRWWVDDQQQSERDDRFDFTASQSGRYRIRVEVDAVDGASHDWQVVIAPRPITETEVNRWLERYLRALEHKDMNTLRKLGYLSSEQDADRLQKQLQARQNYQVLIKDLNAVAQEETVSLEFEQVERWYNPDTYSTVVDYDVSRNLTLARQGCEHIVARHD